MPDALGAGDKKGIEAIFSRNKSQVEACYRRVLQKHGEQPGRFVLAVTIGTDGSVMKTAVTQDEIGKGLAECVETRVKRWKFPNLEKATTIHKRWIFG